MIDKISENPKLNTAQLAAEISVECVNSVSKKNTNN